MNAEVTSLLFPAHVRILILEQHAGLRELLARVLAATTRGLRHEGSREAVVSIVRELDGRFRGHLAYEERHLVPVLARVDDWGPERVQDLLAEHARQRAEFDTLLEGANAGWDTERVALATRSLAADLLMDMEEEERGCLASALLGDQPMMVSTQSPRPSARIKPLHLFDKMAEHAAVWVRDMMTELGTDDPRAALHALRAGLQALRDRLSVDEAAQLSAQLPLVIRGFFFENWDPSRTPVRVRHPSEFLALVREKHGAHSHVAAGDLVAALFRVLGRHVSAGEISDIMMTLPEPLLAVVDPRAAEHRTSER